MATSWTALCLQDAAASPTSSLDGGLPPALDDGNTSVIVYAARYNSGLPYQGPVTVLLREYLPISRKVALNEMMVQQRLWGELPREKWQVCRGHAAAVPHNCNSRVVYEHMPLTGSAATAWI
eukprot:GHRR01033004.1.p1 GENE.GHRR01033004.1~~GHRR01033004.1.p1  ORF type:complete len:122 (+),score=50.67 GHRR01033004.1:356-721(+)